MTQKNEDYSGKIGQLYSHDNVEWPMFSFNRVAYEFWNGFANGLAERGLSDNEIQVELQSKGVRWMLDECDEEIEELGRSMAADYELYVKKESK